MKILIASDHAGFDLKKTVIQMLPNLPWEDLGPHSKDSVDYPDFAHQLAQQVQKAEAAKTSEDSINNSEIGLLICSTGQGMAITANKYAHVRAALCFSNELASLSREHNNANILCLGAKVTTAEDAVSIIQTFLNTAFAGGRHIQRVNKIG